MKAYILYTLSTLLKFPLATKCRMKLMLCDAFDKISKPKLAIQVFENVLFLWIMNDAQVNIWC